MKECPNCAKQYDDNTTVCLACGATLFGKEDTTVEKKKMTKKRTNEEKKDITNILFFVTGVLLPILGFLAYLAYKDDNPKWAASARKGAIIGCFIELAVIALYILFMITLLVIALLIAVLSIILWVVTSIFSMIGAFFSVLFI